MKFLFLVMTASLLLGCKEQPYSGRKNKLLTAITDICGVEEVLSAVVSEQTGRGDILESLTASVRSSEIHRLFEPANVMVRDLDLKLQAVRFVELKSTHATLMFGIYEENLFEVNGIYFGFNNVGLSNLEQLMRHGKLPPSKQDSQ